MPLQDNDILLHKRTHHTNLSVPFSNYISPIIFPEQDIDLLDTIIPVRYRNMYITDMEYSGPDKLDPHDIYTVNCRIIRCDKAEPFRMIVISIDYKFIFVMDSRYYKEQVPQYPIQLTEFIGVNHNNQYPGIIPEVKSITLRVDNGEPCYSVLAEFISDDTIRFLIGDECFSKLIDQHNIKTISFTNINIDILKNSYNKEKTIDEIIEIRKSIFEGRKIYGAKNS